MRYLLKIKFEFEYFLWKKIRLQCVVFFKDQIWRPRSTSCHFVVFFYLCFFCVSAKNSLATVVFTFMKLNITLIYPISQSILSTGYYKWVKPATADESFVRYFQFRVSFLLPAAAAAAAAQREGREQHKKYIKEEIYNRHERELNKKIKTLIIINCPFFLCFSSLCRRLLF